MYQDLGTILNGNKSKKNDIITHTRIGNKKLNIFGGKYTIKDEDMDLFNKLYFIFFNQMPSYQDNKNGTFYHQ